MVNLLSSWEKENKDKRGKQRNKQKKYFSPFLLSVYGIIGKEALVVINNLSRIMAEKIEEPI